MALIQCPECNNMISDSARKCPRCGYRLKRKKLDIVKFTDLFKQISKKKKLLLIVLLIFICVILGVAIYFSPIIPLNQDSLAKVEKINQNISKYSGTVYLIDYDEITGVMSEYDKLSLKEKSNVKDFDKLKRAYDKVKSLKVIYVEKKIEDIKDINLESGQSIDCALKEYYELTDDEKSKVKNYNDLLGKLEKYNKLIVTRTEEAIDTIGTVNLSSINKIKNAENYYASLNDKAKKKVSNSSVLIDARNKYDTLASKRITKLIGNVKTGDLKNKQAIDEAYKLYNSLSSNAKKECKYANVITSLKKELKVNEKKKIKSEKKNKKNSLKIKLKNSLSANFYTEYDEVNKFTGYFPNARPRYMNIRTYVLPYLVKDENGEFYICLRYNYTNEEWVFWDKIVISVDGKNEYKSFDYNDVTRDVTKNVNVVETYSERIYSEDIELLNRIANSKKTIIRFVGKDYTSDMIVSSTDKKAIYDTVQTYELWQEYSGL